MKKTILLILPLLFFAKTFAKETAKHTEGVQFYEASWNDILIKADKENKLIFVDIHASWCSPCKMLKKHTFPDKEVGKFFNKNFINASFDGEEGDGIELVEKYNVQAYPTLLILDKKGNVVAQTMGFMQSDYLIRFGESALKTGYKKQ